jgi:anti-sigma B factor antagonist
MVQLSPVDVVRELWERFERDGIQAALGRIDDDVVYLLQLGGGRVIHGTAEVRSVLSAMEVRGFSFEARLDTLEGSGDAVVASGTVRMQGPEGDREGQYHWVFHFAGGRLRRLSIYGERDEALASLAALNAIAPPPPEFAVAVDEAGGGERVMRPTGELDIGSAPKLERALLDGREPGDRVVLDLAGLEFIDSTGLRVIVHAVAAAASGGWELRLRHGRRAVRRVFEISGVADALPFEDA